MKIGTYEIDIVASELKRLGLGDYYVTQLITNEVDAYSSYDLVNKVRRMVNAGLGDAAIVACLKKRTEPPRRFSSDFQRFCWELDESAHQQKLDRIRREKELEAARSRPVQRTYEEEVTSSVLNIIDGVFEIGSTLLSQRRKK